jgi:hypothetical protein
MEGVTGGNGSGCIAKNIPLGCGVIMDSSVLDGHCEESGSDGGFCAEIGLYSNPPHAAEHGSIISTPMRRAVVVRIKLNRGQYINRIQRISNSNDDS